MSPPLSAHRPLPPGYILDVYQFERVLGKAGAFGITYQARNLSGREQVAIKELFPSDYAIRDPTGHVVVQTVSDEKTFTEAIRMFRREAEILSRVRHDNVVRVLDYLEANGTGYMVMQYVAVSQRLRGQEYSEEFLAAVDWALKLRAEQRPQNIRSWRQALNMARAKSTAVRSQNSPNSSRRLDAWLKVESWLRFWKKYRTIIFFLAGIILMTIVTAWILSLVPE